MDILEQAMKYYGTVTQKDYIDFFQNLDRAITTPNPTGELWLIKKLVDTLNREEGITIEYLKENKDRIKGCFDTESRHSAGEYFTPEIWCKEGRKYIRKYIPDFDNYAVWDCACGTGNLMKSSRHPHHNIFMSTLQNEDVEIVKGIYPEATVFQADFLDCLDYDLNNTFYVDSLPDELQDIIRNDKPLVFYINPPYKNGMAKETEVGRYMCNTGLSAPAYDMYYQFMYKIHRLAEMFKLSNTWVCTFGPLQFFTGESAVVVSDLFRHTFSYVDGMCISAQEFSDTSESITWGIGCTLWKGRGGYQQDIDQNEALLDMKYKDVDGTIRTGEKVLYSAPREKASNWVKAKDIVAYEQAPVMTSHIAFKGYDRFIKKCDRQMRMPVQALGVIMTGNSVLRCANQCAVLSCPTTIQYEFVTKENFWRIVAFFSFRRIVDITWKNGKMELSAPKTTVEGYNKWLMNALVLFLFEYKALSSAHRDVDWRGSKYTVRNGFFPLHSEEIARYCTDEVILEDMKKYPSEEFTASQVDMAMPFLEQEALDLLQFCKNVILNSLNVRKTVDYTASTDCWDANMQQVRSTPLWTDQLEEEYGKRINALKDYLRKDVNKYGFINFEV